MSTQHKIEDLVTVVRRYASSPDVVRRFTEALMAKADGNLEISAEDVTEIVMTWAPACETGKREYLAAANVRVEPALKEYTVEVQFFVRTANADEAWGFVSQRLANCQRTNVSPFFGEDPIHGFEILDGAAFPTDGTKEG